MQTLKMLNFLKKYEFVVNFSREIRRISYKAKRDQLIQGYFKENCVKKLQIGAGSNVLEGWMNTDLFPLKEGVIFLDSTKVFPFEDSVFNYIFTEHQIEHVSYNEAFFMLKECFRVLAPGGRIRVSTPNLIFFTALASVPKNAIQEEYIRWVMDAYIKPGFCAAKEYIPIKDSYKSAFVINDIFQNYNHRFIYDEETLKELLMEAGFASIVHCKPGYSSDENFFNIDSSSDDVAQFGTLVLEGTRP